MSSQTLAIIANGAPLVHTREWEALRACAGCVCCDRTPPEDAPELLQIIGDMDSLHTAIGHEFPAELVTDLHEDQETNDLTKAMHWAKEHYPEAELHFFSVTGRREDHTIANLALIAEEGRRAEIFTEAGHFILLPAGKHTLTVEPNSAISFISFTPQHLSVTGVQWPVQNLLLNTLWRATLNRCTESTLRLDAEAPLYVYQPWSNA